MANYMTTLMVTVRQRLASLKSEEGQGLVEYALILVLVSIAALVALTAIGTNVSDVFDQIQAAL